MEVIKDLIEQRGPILRGELGDLVVSCWYKDEDEPRDGVVEREEWGQSLARGISRL